MTANNPPPGASLLRENIAPFGRYLGASSLWLAGMSLQGFVVSWLLVDRLNATPQAVGWARSMSELVPLGALLIGGVLADRFNNRGYLLSMHLLMAVPPLLLVAIIALAGLNYWWVVAFSACLAGIQGLSDPARQSMLSRLAPTDIQRTVTISTIVTLLAGMLALQLGGQMDRFGDSLVLLALALLFGLGALPLTGLPSLPPVAEHTPRNSWVAELRAGLRATWSCATLRSVILCNFASSLFNAAAYVVALPFIVREVYAGDAVTFANVLIAITIGSTASNFALLKFMPLATPGRVFLWFQLTRALILLLLWADFGPNAFYLLAGLWGVNMGVTSTLARAIVQQRAAEAERARVLSLMLLSFIVAGLIGAPALGYLLAASDPLSALLPGVVISVAIFVFGWASGLAKAAASAQLAPVQEPA